jgi:hypothetical protein
MEPIRQTISLVCALALTAGGLYWLSTIVVALDEHHHVIVGARDFKPYTMIPIMMTVFGLFWLWEDFQLRKGGK